MKPAVQRLVFFFCVLFFSPFSHIPGSKCLVCVLEMIRWVHYCILRVHCISRIDQLRMLFSAVTQPPVHRIFSLIQVLSPLQAGRLAGLLPCRSVLVKCCHMTVWGRLVGSKSCDQHWVYITLCINRQYSFFSLELSFFLNCLFWTVRGGTYTRSKFKNKKTTCP